MSDERWAQYFDPSGHERWVKKALADVASEERVVFGAFDSYLKEGETHAYRLLGCIFLKLSLFENAIEFKNLILPTGDQGLTPYAVSIAKQLIDRAILFCEVRGIQKIETELPQEEHEIISLCLKQHFRVVALRERYSFGNLVCTLERTLGETYRGDPYDTVKFARWLLKCFIPCEVSGEEIVNDMVHISFVVHSNTRAFSKEMTLGHRKRLRGSFWLIDEGDEDNVQAKMILDRFESEPSITLVLCEHLTEEIKKEFDKKGITYFDRNDALEIAGGELSSLCIPMHYNDIGGVITVLEQEQIETYAIKPSLTYYLLSGLHCGLTPPSDGEHLSLAIYCPNWNNKGPGIVALSQIKKIHRPQLRALLEKDLPPDSALNKSDLSFYKTYSESERIAALTCTQIVIFPEPLPIDNGWVSNQRIRDYLQREISMNSCNTAYLDSASIDALRVASKNSSEFQPKGMANYTSVDIHSHYFRVGLSFPGGVRNLVSKIALELESLVGRNGYFYDKNYSSQLAQPSLDILLQDIYRNRSKLIVVFLGGGYEKSDWCGIEFRVIREIIMERDHKRIMLIRTDDDPVGGILKTDGYIDARDHTPDVIASLIQQRADLAD